MESSRIIMATQTRSLPVQLTEDERQQYATQLAQEVATYEVIESEKKEVTARLGKQLKEQRAAAAGIMLDAGV